MSRPCVFFDRDGIVNQPPVLDRYVRSWEEFVLIPEFVEALRTVAAKGYQAVLVTNQKGVSTGRMTSEAVETIHRNLRALLADHKLELLDVFVCPGGEDDDPNRKPNPGMILEAARKHDLDLSRSWMIGDNEKDVEAGRRAGCRTVLVSDKNLPSAADYKLKSMADLPDFLAERL